ncbi:MAG: hypothetical protein KA198_02680 [Chitinophagaceae bacterium]|nr:hypothetical protein [Chitinophagaceae bacterium]
MFISKDQTLQQLQEQFQQKFSSLALAFYAKKHADGEVSQVADQLNMHLFVKDVQQKDHEGSVALNDEMTVETFEHICALHFGLYVQVLRKSGQQWLQTTRTDHWTLAKQQEEAELMHSTNSNEDLGDYHEQE